MKYQIVSQLYADAEAQRKGTKQVLDDCTWASCAAAVSWASRYTVNYTAAQGVAAFEKATGRKDKQGVSDAGGSLAEAVKTVAVLGGKARYAKSWNDAIVAGKQGAALLIWVQQPVGYPSGFKISAWHDRWQKYWHKTDPKHEAAGYGHMTSAGWDGTTWRWACPTRDEKVAAEQFAVPVTEAELRQIANSKVKAGKVAADYKCLLIVTYSTQPVVLPTPTKTNVAAVAPATATLTPAPQKAPPGGADAALQALKATDWQAVGQASAEALKGALGAAAKENTVGSKIKAAIWWLASHTQIDEAVLEAVRVFLTTSIAVALATGAPLLDMTGSDFRTVVSGGLAAALNVLVRFLQPTDTQFGVKTKP